MKHLLSILSIIVFGILFFASSSSKQVAQAPTVQRIPAKFHFDIPSQAKAGSTNITIAIVNPTYVGENAEYFVSPFKEMALNMGNDFQALLTAKGFTVRGPFRSRDEMVYNDKVNSSFILEISIELNPHYERKSSTSSKANWAGILNPSSPAINYTQKMTGEVTLTGNLVINAKSSQYGELIWKKSLPLDVSSFTYTGSKTWAEVPTMKEELDQDNLVYNTFSKELEKIYEKALNLAWLQIDPSEMKTIAAQSKKADKKGT